MSKIQKAIVKLRSRKILIQTEIEEKREENTLKQTKIKKETTEAKIKFVSLSDLTAFLLLISHLEFLGRF